jgi:hypothetical protein
MKNAWLYFVLGALVLWFFFGRKVTATVTAGDGTARYLPTPVGPAGATAATALTATSAERAALAAFQASLNFGYGFQVPNCGDTGKIC